MDRSNETRKTQPARLNGVRGMNDVLPADEPLWRRFEEAVVGVMRAYGYSQIRTPIVEHTRLFVAEHRAGVPEALRAGVEQAVLQHGTHAGGGAFRSQRQRFAVERVDKGIHLLLDNVGHLADGA